jgi:hypothetical protein
MKSIGGVEVQLYEFLTSALDGGRWSASCSGRFTYRGKSPRYPLDRRLGGPQNRSGHGGEEKNSHNCTRPELILGRPARSLVSVLTELYCKLG